MPIPKWLSELEADAGDGRLGDKLEGWPLDNKVYACPWLRHYVQNFSDKPRMVFVLQDWGMVSDSGPLDGAMEAVSTRQNDDRTMREIFMTPGMHEALNSPAICFMNAVWGLRTRGRKSGPLPDDIHRASFPIWAQALLKLKPDTVCLCGSWARDKKIAMDHAANGASVIKEWIAWAQPKEPISFSAKDFSQMEFNYLPHPSAPGLKFKPLAAKLIKQHVQLFG